MKTKVGVYQIFNSKTLKRYIGSSSDIESRWKEHIWALRSNKHKNSHLQRAWNKYGKKSFTFLIIEHVADEKYLIAREQYWIDSTKALENGYNMCPIAGTSKGRKWSKARHKIPHPLLGKRHSEETKKKIAATSRKRTDMYTPEYRAKMSKAVTGRKVSTKTRKKISKAHKGKTLTKAHRHKLSIAQQKRWKKYHGEQI